MYTIISFESDVSYLNVIRFAKESYTYMQLYIYIENYHFELLNTVYVRSLIYVRNSSLISSLLDKFHAISYSFFHKYHKWLNT